MRTRDINGTAWDNVAAGVRVLGKRILGVALVVVESKGKCHDVTPGQLHMIAVHCNLNAAT